MKVFVAIQAYDRKVCCETVRALLDEQSVAAAAGIDLITGFVTGSAYIHIARDQCVQEFRDSGADRLVFIDSDVAWEPGALLKIALAKQDFVGGCYRFKRDVEGYPVEWLQDRAELWADPETGLLEVSALPGGFLSLSRAVFDRLEAAHPERRYAHEGHERHSFFHCPPGGGEDGTLCAEWRAIGGQVWLDPMLRLTHVDGGRAYVGCIGDWLRARPEEVLRFAMAESAALTAEIEALTAPGAE